MWYRVLVCNTIGFADGIPVPLSHILYRAKLSRSRTLYAGCMHRGTGVAIGKVCSRFRARERGPRGVAICVCIEEQVLPQVKCSKFRARERPERCGYICEDKDCYKGKDAAQQGFELATVDSSAVRASASASWAQVHDRACFNGRNDSTALNIWPFFFNHSLMGLTACWSIFVRAVTILWEEMDAQYWNL